MTGMGGWGRFLVVVAWLVPACALASAGGHEV